jgi:hypothetical protein
MPDGTILSGRIHGLKDQKHRMAVGGVEELLLCAQLLNMIAQNFLILILRFIYGIDPGRPLIEIDLISFLYSKVFFINFHVYPLTDTDGTMGTV